MRILIVDDEEETLNAMAHFLAGTDAEILPVSESAEAAWYIANEHFDAMMIDYVMAPPDGLELTRLARRSSLNHGTPVILVTGYDDLDTRAKGAKAGVTRCLAKPFSPERIRSVLRAALTNPGFSEAPGVHLAGEFGAS